MILYQRTKTGAIQVWEGWTVGPMFYIKWGQLDGKTQTTIQQGTYQNKGKSNEVHPAGHAKQLLERRIKLQLEKGYTTHIYQQVMSATLPDILPKNLCFYKPTQQNNRTESAIQTDDIVTIKRDGMMHIAHNNRLYTRRMDDVTHLHPHLPLPPDSTLLGELIYILPNGNDDFETVATLCRSKKPHPELGRLTFYIFDVIRYNGKDVSINPYLYRLANAKESTYIQRAEILTPLNVMKQIKDRQLEGVVIHKNMSFTQTSDFYSFNGKPPRPSHIWKLKPKYEQDFQVRFDPPGGIGNWGKGKNQDVLGNVDVYKIEGNLYTYICKCGGGLTDKQRRFYANLPCEAWPRIWQIEYDSITPDGSLRFPVFVKDKTDESLQD